MSSGDKGVQGLQYLNYFSYSLKFLLLNVSLFYLKQDKRAFTTQIFPALVFSNEGGFYMSGNREYKSDVFSMLMESKENALEVYNALNDSEYTNPEEVEIVQLERGVSLSIRNDASFIIDMNINFYEPQPGMTRIIIESRPRGPQQAAYQVHQYHVNAVYSYIVAMFSRPPVY